MAGRLAIARPGGAWVLGVHARARGGHRARLRERSAPELTERVTEGPALGTVSTVAHREPLGVAHREPVWRRDRTPDMKVVSWPPGQLAPRARRAVSCFF